MFVKQLSLLAFASQAFAQNTPSLVQALNSSTDLTTLSTVLGLVPELVTALGSAQNITILAPSNAAFAKVDNATLSALQSNTGLLSALLQYHVLNATVPSSAITNTSAFVPTLLTNSAFTNVTGGQVVSAKTANGGVSIFSGLAMNSSVTTADVAFTGGVIHIIDTVLTIPETASNTAIAAGLSSLAGALTAANLVETVDTTKDVTIFAPSNAAFQAIGSGLGNLTTEQVTSVLTYHVVAGAVGYSSGLTNGTSLKTVNGANLTITVVDGKVFVNGARVITPDVLVANGVVHVIDNVLNPANASIADPSASAGSPAFSGASSVSDAPFTSGVPTASKTLGGGATPTGSAASSSAPAASTGSATQNGAVGVGALLGAAAVYFL
ncbi:hypothetical protein HBH61_056670 [Parastagonospora nodorum]|nr:hypothetical protein HBH42_021730 [Parastagonospora nodorum]KAH4816816.1 hypothetical protein HBH61_056670 [Parastagonospora nodorum]KAH4987762.1 hypothetical protein HBI76_100390 [Parastagonospora nodorum]KAH5042006.1 hypothetical protein HBI75_036310 [Parastagonospora nodorum]KAH5652580.1 hypothetical protein HBI51_073040 [Parastagonospora nodorum]